jgi:hypothetical protein
VRSLGGGQMRVGGLLAERPEPEPGQPELVRMKEQALDVDETVAAWGWDFPKGVNISGCQLRVDADRGLVLWVLQDGSNVIHVGEVGWDALDAKSSARRS